MKFPLSERPFDSVQLSPARYASLARLAQDVVDANLREFHNFVHLHNRVLSPAQFKPIKKHDKITVYKELTHRTQRVFGPLGRRVCGDGPLILPKLVVTGTIRGRMEDMLLGTAVRDPASVVIKTSYVDDEIVDCSVLHELQGASEEDPYRFLALKWIVKAKSSGINSVIVPRDMIVIQSSGLIADEGIGYHLLHSVDSAVPECPPLDNKFSISRSRTSTMFIFRQLANDLIEIYTANYVEPNGSVPESVAIASAAKSLSSSWKSLECAYNMKLSWILKNKDAYLGKKSSQDRLGASNVCELCTKKATLTGRLDDCSVCEARVCSRCRDTKSLAKANRRLEVKVEKVEICKTCLYRAVHEDATRIAAEMNCGAAIMPWDSLKESSTRRFSHERVMSTRSLERKDSVRSISSRGSDRGANSLAYSKLIDTRPNRTVSTASSAYTDLDFDGSEFHDHDSNRKLSTDDLVMDEDEEREKQQYREHLNQQEHFRTLYAQMKTLQLAADKTYEVARENERKLSRELHTLY